MSPVCYDSHTRTYVNNGLDVGIVFLKGLCSDMYHCFDSWWTSPPALKNLRITINQFSIKLI
jgi:hypothetical protein